MYYLVLAAYGFIPLILAITLHEAAHAFVAKKYGDLTSYNLGRVSLNPLVHVDPIGTILLPLITMMLSGFIFGWAKPVPVDFGRLNNPKKDSVIVAAAGPFANLLMALGWTVIFFSASYLPVEVKIHIVTIAKLGVIFNISFMIFNLLPILPLDGGRIVAGLLPHKLSFEFSKLEPYGMWIVLILVMSGILSPTMLYVRNLIGSMLLG
jgi:Zn-dependent protease